MYRETYTARWRIRLLPTRHECHGEQAAERAGTPPSRAHSALLTADAQQAHAAAAVLSSQLGTPLSGCRAQYLDVTPWAGGSCQSFVAGKQAHLQQFGERDVGRIVDGEVVAKFPATGKQRAVRGPLQGHRGKVGKRQGRAAAARWRKTAWVCSGTSLICTLGMTPLWRY